MQKTVKISTCRTVIKFLTENWIRCAWSVTAVLFWASAKLLNCCVITKMDDDSKTIQNFHTKCRRWNIPDPSVMFVWNTFQSLGRTSLTSSWITEAEKVSKKLKIQFILTSFTHRDQWIMGEIMVVNLSLSLITEPIMRNWYQCV